MKIHLAKLAEKDLQEVETYIRQDNPTAARRVIDRIFEAIDYLPQFPNMGRPGRVSNTRELIVSSTPFIIIYQIRHRNLYILRILHTARKWPP